MHILHPTGTEHGITFWRCQICARRVAVNKGRVVVLNAGDPVPHTGGRAPKEEA